MANVQQFFNMVFRPDPEKSREDNLKEIIDCLEKFTFGNNYRITLELADLKKEDISDINKFLRKIEHDSDMAGQIDFSAPVSVDANGSPLFGLKE